MKRINYGEIHDMLSNQMHEIYKMESNKEDFKAEIERAKAMEGLASQVINLGKLQLQGAKFLGSDDNIEKLYIDQK